MIRKAKIKDIKAIHSLLQIYSSKGELLPRPFSKLYDHLRDFIVYADGKSGEIIGCCALQFCWEDLAEIRSLAVHPDYLRKNIGTLLAETVLAEAKTYDIRKVFSLTYKPAFFEINMKILTQLSLLVDFFKTVKYCQNPMYAFKNKQLHLNWFTDAFYPKKQIKV